MKHHHWTAAVLAIVATAFLELSTLSAAYAQGTRPQIEFQTNQGTFVIEMRPDKAPKSVENFIQYVNEGFYNGTVFHRVINGFVVQGGGFDGSMKQKATRAPIANESDNGLVNERGAVAMARTMDPNSATSQFYIDLADNSQSLNPPGRPGYAVFGKVVRGMDVIDKIAQTPTTNAGMYQDVPREPVVVQKATVITH